jgi:enoyl-CoA hydratase/carnithine racemase
LPDINFQKGKKSGAIFLDREKTLNALTPDMLVQLEKQLDLWEQDNQIHHILIHAKGSRAFCSGADIRSFYETSDREKNAEFCSNEYRINRKLFHFSKPYIALIDGLVMGGGVGISQYGKYKIATENYQFAMPEVLIGFFPDVASSYFFVKMPYHIGWYLALTGSRINRERGVSLGLITHAIQTEEKELWIQRILETENIEKELEQIQIVSSFAPTPRDLEIEYHFSKPSLQQIFYSLRSSSTSFAKETLAHLEKLSPLSLLVTFEALKRSITMSFDEVIAMDTGIAKAFMHDKDIYEGIRAKIIDKDQNPSWSHSSMDRVSQSNIANFFCS